ncbi:MAG: DUF2878 domain-containing protein [Desulfuromonas sp.]|nr:MAG: DUF2878 domain-containing protein [Desulfuromonas sp.]
MLSANLSKILNLALYQIGWFCCVLGAAGNYSLAGAGIALLLIAIHLLLADNREAELTLVLLTTLYGVLLDSLQQAAGLLLFKSDPRWPFWMPLWVFIIWAQFATLFRYALNWLGGQYLLGALFGFFGGPLAYWSGVRLGAAEFGRIPLLSLGILAVVWSLSVPLLLRLRQMGSFKEGRYRIPRR